jgi:hypothetical protein
MSIEIKTDAFSITDGDYVPLNEAERGPQDFTELIGTVSLAPNVFVLATHGRTEPILTADEYPEIPLHPEFTDVMQKNFTDRATYGSEEEPGITMYYSKDKMLVPPPNPRIVGDSARSSDAVRYTPVTGEQKVDGQDNIRSADFLMARVFKDNPSEEQMEAWLNAENGARSYHQAIKAAYVEQLEVSDVPVIVFDIHDTSEWGIEAATDGSARSMVYRTTPSKNPDSTIGGFPLAVVSDLEGAATGSKGYIDVFRDELQAAYEEVGVEDTSVWGKVEANSLFKGGYVTKLLGVELPEELIREGREDLAEKIAVIQIEVNRTNLINDTTQEINQAATYIEANVLAKAMNGLADKIASDFRTDTR